MSHSAAAPRVTEAPPRARISRHAPGPMLMIAGIVLLAIVVGAPALGRPPDPSIIQAQPRPDWYLLWYFAVLALLPAQLETPVIVLGPLLFGAILLVIPVLRNRGERHPLRRPWAIGVVALIWVMIGTLWIEGKRAPWSPDFSAQPLQAQVVGTTSGPVAEGGKLFHQKGCEFCHAIAGHGGHRGNFEDLEAGLRKPRATDVDPRVKILEARDQCVDIGGRLHSPPRRG